MMIEKILTIFLIFLLNSSNLSDAKSVRLTKLTQPLSVTFPGQETVRTEKRVIIKQIEFKCPDSGLFANEHDCETYYECSGAEVVGKPVKCPKDKLWSDKLKICTDPLSSTCATLKVIHRTVPGVALHSHLSADRRVLYRLVGDKLGGSGPSLMGQGYHLIKRIRLVPTEQIEQQFKQEGVPNELIQYYDKIKTRVPSYFLEVYQIQNDNKLHVLSVVELVDLYKKRSLTPVQLIQFYITNGQIPQELITYYQKHPVHFETEQERNQLTRITGHEILEDLNNNKLILEQLIECYLKQGQLPENVITWVREHTKVKVVTVTVDQLIDNYKKKLLQPIQLIEYYTISHKIPEELILYYQQHPPQYETEEQKIQLTRLSLEQILEDIKNKKLLIDQLIEFYLKHGQIPQEVITLINAGHTKTEVTVEDKMLDRNDENRVIDEKTVPVQPDDQVKEDNKPDDQESVIVEAYKTNKLDIAQLVKFYKISKKLPQQLIVYYQEHPPQFESDEQKNQLTRVTIEQILEDMQNKRLLPAQLIELYIKQGQIPDEIITLFDRISTKIEGTVNGKPNGHSKVVALQPDQLIELYKNNQLLPSQLIELYIVKHTIPQELILYYQKHPQQFETEEQKIQLTRLTVDQILEDMKANKLLTSQLIEFYIKSGRIPEEVITWFQTNQKTDRETMITLEPDQLVQLYKKHELNPLQLIEFFIVRGTIPEQLITYYKKHPVQFEKEEQKTQLTRLTIEEIIDDFKNGRILTEQLIELFLKQGQIPEQIITWVKEHKTEVTVTKNLMPDSQVVGIRPDQLIEWYKQKTLKPIQLIQYYLAAKELPKELIVFYQQNPPQTESEDERKQMSRFTVDEILEDLKNNRLLAVQLIELFIRTGEIPEQIIAWHPKRTDAESRSEPDDQELVLLESYKNKKLDIIQLIQFYKTSKKIPQQLIVYYQEHPPQFESDEQKNQLTRVTIEQILEDMQKNRLIPEQLIELYKRQGRIPDEVITLFDKITTKPQVSVDTKDVDTKDVDIKDVDIKDVDTSVRPDQLIELYKTNQLLPTQLIEFYITSHTIPQELILYYQKHPPQFESEEQKKQLTRLTVEEILDDLKNGKLIVAQLIEFFLKQGRLDDQIVVWFKEHNSNKPESDGQTTITIDPTQLVDDYKKNQLKPEVLIEYYITKKEIPQQLIVYYQKHPHQYQSEEQKTQLTRLTIDEILEDVKNNRVLPEQLIEFYLKNGQIPEQLIVFFRKHVPKQAMEEVPGKTKNRVVINKEALIENYKKNTLEPTQLIQYFILKHEIPQDLIVYYQKHPPQYESEEQKIQLTRLSVEEILEDLKGGRLLPSQLIEFYLKQGHLPQQIITWFQKHDTRKEVTEETTVVTSPKVLIEKYKEHSLKPTLLLQYYLTTHTIPEQLILYYQKHPEIITEEERKQITRLNVEDILEDLKNNRLIPGQLIEFYLRKKEIPQQLIVWFQKHRPAVVTEERKHVIINKEQLINRYKQHKLNPYLLIEYFITKHTIPQELIVYYQKHPPRFSSEEEKVQVTRLNVEEILEDLKTGRLLPYQLIEFYLRRGQIPREVIVWFQKHRPVIHKEVTEVTEVTKDEPRARFDIKDLIHYYKTGQLKPEQLLQWYVVKKELPSALLAYFQEHPPQTELTPLSVREIYDQLKSNQLSPAYLIQLYLKYKRFPKAFVEWFDKKKEAQVAVDQPIPGGQSVLVEQFKKNVLTPQIVIDYFIKTGQIPEDFIVYYKEHPIQATTEEERLHLKRLKIEQILEDLRSKKLTLTQLIEFYLRQKTIPEQILVAYQELRPDPSVSIGAQCKAYVSEGDDELDLSQLCGSCRASTYAVPHPNSHKKYVVCNVGQKHVVRRCSHGLVFDKTFMTCEKENVVAECAISTG